MHRTIAATLLVAMPVSVALAQGSSLDRVTSGTDFNPKISVIFDGVYYNDNVDGEGNELLGEVDGISHAHGHEGEHSHGHGSAGPGFNLRTTEITLSGSVDHLFEAFANIAVDSDGGVALEEAYFISRGLPAGLMVKGGKFLSDIGTINNQHPHQWDFVDQNLAYQSLIGEHGLQDTGLQLRWLPALDTYLEVGFEALQGEQDKLGTLADEDEIEADGVTGLDDRGDGPRLFTVFTKWSPDLGYSHTLRLGLFGAYATQHQEIHDDPAVHALEGDAWLAGTDWVYGYDAAGNYGQGDLKLQAEYLYAVKDLEVAYHEANAAAVGQTRELRQDGFYAQAVYGFAPRWDVAVRYDATGWTNEKTDGSDTLEDWDSSERGTLAVAFRPSHFSMIRLQAARSSLSVEGEREPVNQVFLQYQLSLGSHGAHTF
ncbi:hypothetical protein H0Z60_04360 [Ectothiorhodospiraceae bacterium WFHF3C12]|nr:hypothetical protein [Ectothiorhodospiraceae bacterium WFHF3C12]